MNLTDNEDLDPTPLRWGYAVFGRVVEGMNVADALNSEYGESSGSGIRAGKQQPLFDGGKVIASLYATHRLDILELGPASYVVRRKHRTHSEVLTRASSYSAAWSAANARLTEE